MNAFAVIVSWHAERCVRFDMPIVRHKEEVNYLRHLLRLVRNVYVASEFQGLGLCCFEDSTDRFYLVADVDAWWGELVFEGRQRYRAWDPRFVGRHSLEIFALPPSKRNDFYVPVPNCCEQKSNLAL